jgi:hypothetical protein
MFIYLLKLENDKYYVGRTKKPPKDRFNEHIIGQGSAWTQIHKPLEIMEVIESQDKFDEDKLTIQTMEKYGIDNVRGGTFVQKDLSDEDKLIIKKMLDSSNNKCFNCSSLEHYVKDCPNNKKQIICYKCGEPNHYANRCSKKFVTKVVKKIPDNILNRENNQISINTINGDNLYYSESKQLADIIKFKERENIKVLYVYGGNFKTKINILKETIIGVTNERIFKLENGKKDYVFINDILSVTHVKNGFFSWDKIECQLKNNNTNTFGIYHSKSCEYFCNYLTMQITK